MTTDKRIKMDISAGKTRLALILDSFARLTGRPLIADGQDMWEAARIILAHDTQTPPRFIYGNGAALALFAMSADQFIGLPSYKSAEAELRQERADMLAKLERANIIHDYSGIRIAADGTRFRIRNADVWNLIDENGQKHGQAASFSDWQLL